MRKEKNNIGMTLLKNNILILSELTLYKISLGLTQLGSDASNYWSIKLIRLKFNYSINCSWTYQLYILIVINKIYEIKKINEIWLYITVDLLTYIFA